jgi:hypothetical protein
MTTSGELTVDPDRLRGYVDEERSALILKYLEAIYAGRWVTVDWIEPQLEELCPE